MKDSTRDILNYVLLFLIVGFCVLAGVNILVATLLTSGAQLKRFTVLALPGNVVGGPGETAARVELEVRLDPNKDTQIDYYARTITGMTDITAIRIRGPKDNGLATGPVYAALCGAPGPACDTTSTPGIVQGSVFQIFGVPSTSVRVAMNTIRDRPVNFYLEVLTNDKPVQPGAARADLTE